MLAERGLAVLIIGYHCRVIIRVLIVRGMLLLAELMVMHSSVSIVSLLKLLFVRLGSPYSI